MLGADRGPDTAADITAWGGRDRAAKVAAAAATIAHGWDRLAGLEVDRLCEALEDHALAYLDWMSDMNGPAIHDLRGLVTTIRSANAVMRERDDAVVRGTLAPMLGRAATQLVDRINTAGRVVDLPA